MKLHYSIRSWNLLEGRFSESEEIFRIKDYCSIAFSVEKANETIQEEGRRNIWCAVDNAACIDCSQLMIHKAVNNSTDGD